MSAPITPPTGPREAPRDALTMADVAGPVGTTLVGFGAVMLLLSLSLLLTPLGETEFFHPLSKGFIGAGPMAVWSGVIAAVGLHLRSQAD